MLHKTGDKSDPNNYREISLVNIIAKIFFQILLTRLTAWLNEVNILPEYQAGLRPGSSIHHIFTLNSSIQIHVSIPKRQNLCFLYTFQKFF